jgi:hypothetical protein
MVRRVYGHHNPVFMREAAEAIQTNHGRLKRHAAADFTYP